MEEDSLLLRDGVTWIQVVQTHTLAKQQVKMQQHTMLQVNTPIYPIVNKLAQGGLTLQS